MRPFHCPAQSPICLRTITGIRIMYRFRLRIRRFQRRNPERGPPVQYRMNCTFEEKQTCQTAHSGFTSAALVKPRFIRFAPEMTRRGPGLTPLAAELKSLTSGILQGVARAPTTFRFTARTVFYALSRAASPVKRTPIWISAASTISGAEGSLCL